MENDRHQTFNKKSENARSLGKMINNTKENIEQAEISMEFAAPEELEHLEEKMRIAGLPLPRWKNKYAKKGIRSAKGLF